MLQNTTHTTVFREHDAPSGPRDSVVSPTQNCGVVHDIADSMHKPPVSLTHEYLVRCERAAAYLGNPSTNSFTAPGAREVPVTEFTRSPRFPAGGDSDMSLRGCVSAARNNVFDVVNRVSSFISRAKNAGFAPPSNPFIRIAEINSKRTGWTPAQFTVEEADEIVLNIGAYVDLLNAEKNGKIDLVKNAEAAAQLSSATISMDGFGGSGDAAADLLRFLPDMDAVKSEQAREALSALDFTKRIPKTMFSAEYAPHGNSLGALIGWKRIADASGYIVTRRNVFDQKAVSYTFTNQQLIDLTDALATYLKTWVLSFYDNVSLDNIFAFVDPDVNSDAYYLYTIRAFQLKNDAKNTLFSVTTRAAPLLTQTKKQVRDLMEQLDPGAGADVVSPYPILAHILLGDQKLDWVLAGVNIRASISRGDQRSDTRKYSYLAAQLDFLLDKLDKGLFVVPVSVEEIAVRIREAIIKFGVTQVLQEILQETGILYYFEGKDPREDGHFDRVGSGVPQTSNLLNVVLAAADGETATLDLKAIASNIPQLLAGGTSASSRLDAVGMTSRPQEIVVPDVNTTTDQLAEDSIQFLRKLGNLEETQVDLTTFEGISVFVRTIRIVSDVGPSRGAPINAPPAVIIPDPVPSPPPPDPTPNSPGSDPRPQPSPPHPTYEEVFGDDNVNSDTGYKKVRRVPVTGYPRKSKFEDDT